MTIRATRSSSSIFQGLSDYYTSQGVDSAVFRNDVDTQTLDGVDLLVVGLPFLLLHSR